MIVMDIDSLTAGDISSQFKTGTKQELVELYFFL